MKSLWLVRPERTILILLSIIMVLGYQNCSNQMAFDGSANSTGKIADTGTESDTPGTPADDPTAALPPDDDDQDTDIDYDHDGKKVAFSCTTGATLKFSEDELLKAEDLTLFNKRGFIFHYKGPLKNVDVRDIKGSILVKNAHQIRRFEDVSGMVAYSRALSVVSVRDVQGVISSTASIRLDSLDKIRAAYICASGNEIGKVSDLQGLFVKIRGRPPLGVTNSSNGKAKELSRIRAGFTSIYKLDVDNISDFEGELIIRNSSIDTIDGLRGGLTLINSTVKSLKNAEGKLRTLNSTVDSKTNVNMQDIKLPSKK